MKEHRRSRRILSRMLDWIQSNGLYSWKTNCIYISWITALRDGKYISSIKQLEN